MVKGKTGKSRPSGQPALPSALSTPWAFLCPTDELHTLIAESAKRLLDPLAASIVEQQSARHQLNRKRKRSEAELDSGYPHLQLKNLYIDGFTSNQIWEQATRILESAGSEVERDVTLLADQSGYPSSADEEQLDSLSVSDPEAPGSESDDADSMSDDMEDTSGNEIDEELDEGSDHLDEEESDDTGEMVEELGEDHDPIEPAEGEPSTYLEDKFGLNDGFFSIDDFNKQSEMLERQDARGGADDDDDSDEEVDWHADPLVAGNAIPAAKNDATLNARRLDGDDMDDSSEEDGPTFGNADLQGDFESDGDASDTGDADANDWINTSDIKYADFFAPPARKASSKKARALPKTQPAEAITDDDVDRAMADVRRDLFDDESEAGEDEGDGLDESGDPQIQRSTHEKQRARIADEIRRLEAASVAKKDWTLSGEARAVERPVNSLIEEDLDFERVGKPVPVVTNETTEDIEELVKRRILAKEFDEVIRRRPGASDTHASRNSRYELEDTKPQQSLAELYETDHLRATDPNYVDPKDRKLMREHSEVTQLWKEISSQLDTLSNWHYKPKVPQASINVVTDAPTIMMEEARPTAGSAAGGPSALAPQEIYAPGDDGRIAGEVVLKSGATISKDEMSREEKARARRHKKNQRKSEPEPPRQKGKAAEKQQLVSDLKKGGVKVINKEGQVTDMSGGRVGEGPKSSADFLKL